MTETPTTDMGARIREAFDGIDMHKAMRLVFSKCPECGKRMERGPWLRWCPDRACKGYVGVLNKGLGRKIDAIAPQTDEEQAQLDRLAKSFGVNTR